MSTDDSDIPEPKVPYSYDEMGIGAHMLRRPDGLTKKQMREARNLADYAFRTLQAGKEDTMVPVKVSRRFMPSRAKSPADNVYHEAQRQLAPHGVVIKHEAGWNFQATNTPKGMGLRDNIAFIDKTKDAEAARSLQERQGAAQMEDQAREVIAHEALTEQQIIDNEPKDTSDPS